MELGQRAMTSLAQLTPSEMDLECGVRKSHVSCDVQLEKASLAELEEEIVL
jgi:hypothetical protein